MSEDDLFETESGGNGPGNEPRRGVRDQGDHTAGGRSPVISDLRMRLVRMLYTADSPCHEVYVFLTPDGPRLGLHSGDGRRILEEGLDPLPSEGYRFDVDALLDRARTSEGDAPFFVEGNRLILWPHARRVVGREVPRPIKTGPREAMGTLRFKPSPRDLRLLVDIVGETGVVVIDPQRRTLEGLAPDGQRITIPDPSLPGSNLPALQLPARDVERFAHLLDRVASDAREGRKGSPPARPATTTIRYQAPTRDLFQEDQGFAAYEISVAGAGGIQGEAETMKDATEERIRASGTGFGVALVELTVGQARDLRDAIDRAFRDAARSAGEYHQAQMPSVVFDGSMGEIHICGPLEQESMPVEGLGNGYAVVDARILRTLLSHTKGIRLGVTGGRALYQKGTTEAVLPSGAMVEIRSAQEIWSDARDPVEDLISEEVGRYEGRIPYGAEEGADNSDAHAKAMHESARRRFTRFIPREEIDEIIAWCRNPLTSEDDRAEAEEDLFASVYRLLVRWAGEVRRDLPFGERLLIAQSAFVTALRSTTFRPEEGSFIAYLRLTVRRELLSAPLTGGVHVPETVRAHPLRRALEGSQDHSDLRREYPEMEDADWERLVTRLRLGSVAMKPTFLPDMDAVPDYRYADSANQMDLEVDAAQRILRARTGYEAMPAVERKYLRMTTGLGGRPELMSLEAGQGMGLHEERFYRAARKLLDEGPRRNHGGRDEEGIRVQA